MVRIHSSCPCMASRHGSPGALNRFGHKPFAPPCSSQRQGLIPTWKRLRRRMEYQWSPMTVALVSQATGTSLCRSLAPLGRPWLTRMTGTRRLTLSDVSPKHTASTMSRLYSLPRTSASSHRVRGETIGRNVCCAVWGSSQASISARQPENDSCSRLAIRYLVRR